ncbi:hypothetical protein NL108_013994 [Boleophthalmus pectinirostris]|nr:hypothetical protein NL108_013994 [Boleophthalmus pectinirostris]
MSLPSAHDTHFCKSETNTVILTEWRHGAASSKPGNHNLSHLFGSTEGASDSSLWTQLLQRLYPNQLGPRAKHGRIVTEKRQDVYADKDLVVPEKWEESGPQIISQSEEVRLRSFTTSIHKVNSMVAYKRSDSL